jgi:hypothetical protein
MQPAGASDDFGRATDHRGAAETTDSRTAGWRPDPNDIA